MRRFNRAPKLGRGDSKRPGSRGPVRFEKGDSSSFGERGPHRFDREHSGQFGDKPKFGREDGEFKPKFGRDSGKFGDKPKFKREGGFGDKPKFGRDRGFGDRPKFSRDSGSFERRDSGFEKKMHEVTCDKCGELCEVPFRPTGGKPVYCSSCFRKVDYESKRGIAPSNSKELEEIHAKLDKIMKGLGIE